MAFIYFFILGLLFGLGLAAVSRVARLQQNPIKRMKMSTILHMSYFLLKLIFRLDTLPILKLNHYCNST